MPGVPFQIPQVPDNTQGWGPTDQPSELKDIPFAPFSKSDKLGRVSDFTAQGKNFGRFGQRMDPVNPVFNFFANDEEDDFHLVDNKPTQRGRGQRRFVPNRFQQQQQRREQERREALEAGIKQPRQKQQQQRNRYNNFRDQQRQQYTSSVDIRPDWRMVEQINFPALSKLSMTVAEPQDLQFCGQLSQYDKAFDRINAKNTKRLEKTSKVFSSVSTSDDPVLSKYVLEKAATVFATDVLLTALMTSPRSQYPWDLLAVKKDGMLVFEMRPGSNIDLFTVGETAPDAISDDKDTINGMQQLMMEATAINRNFSQQVLSSEGDKHDCGAPNPFTEAAEGKELAGTAYRYRKWSLSDTADIIVRCEVDGVTSIKNQEQLMLIKALNEYDSRVTGLDWRQKLDTQRGAVLATELKNNAAKVARWTTQALLASADVIKIGFVSRVSSRDNTAHVILGTQNAKPREFAQQINLSFENCWGIVRAIVDLLMTQEDGKFLLIKDPNKPTLRIYEVPMDSFESLYVDEEGDGEDEEDADEPGDADLDDAEE